MDPSITAITAYTILVVNLFFALNAQSIYVISHSRLPFCTRSGNLSYKQEIEVETAERICRNKAKVKCSYKPPYSLVIMALVLHLGYLYWVDQFVEISLRADNCWDVSLLFLHTVWYMTLTFVPNPISVLFIGLPYHGWWPKHLWDDILFKIEFNISDYM